MFRQETVFAFSRALLKAGSSIEARMAMIAMTTSSSIRVKGFFIFGWVWGGMEKTENRELRNSLIIIGKAE